MTYRLQPPEGHLEPRFGDRVIPPEGLVLSDDEAAVLIAGHDPIKDLITLDGTTVATAPTGAGGE